ncbi:MAG: hypothetical protein QW096_10425 [Thermofilaceae archaeon]
MPLFLSDEWFLANEDLIDMMKIPKKIVTTSHYPFNDIAISSIRPNYLEYPISFLLQAMLSLILNINIDTLILYPLASWAAYILTLLIALNFIIELRHCTTLESYSTTYVMGLIMFNFLTLSFFMYFIYSNIIRALIVLNVYMLMKHVADKRLRSKYTFMLLLLLFTSIVLGHSQEPMMLFLYLILLVTVLTIIKALRWGNISDVIFGSIVRSAILYSVLFLFINMFYAVSTYSSIIEFISRLISNLIGKLSLESLVVKEEISMQVLTRFEIYILRVTLLLNVLVIFGVLISYLKESISNRNMLALSAVISSGAFLIINGLIVFYQGILSDLIFRSLWVFLCSLIPIYMFVKSAHPINRNSGRMSVRFKRIIILLLIIALSLFIVSNIIYCRYHMLTSDVYIHESLTVKMLSSLKKLISTSNVLHSQVLIVDTPEYPSYEVGKALVLLTNKTYKMIIYLDPEVPNYRYSYLNGILKPRIPLKDTNVITTLESCNYSELEIYVIGQIKYCLQRHLSIIFSVNEDLGLGLLHNSSRLKGLT